MKSGDRLRVAIASRGIECIPLSLRDCGFDIGGASHGLRLPGFGEDLPNAAIVRFISAGTFEEVTARLGILHALESLGVPVCNSPVAIERCVDKASTSFHVARHGLPTPRTWVSDDPETAATIVKREAGAGAPLVLKPLFGAQGRGLRLLESPDDLPPPDHVAGLYYLQRYIASGEGGAKQGWRDWRVLVCDGRPIAAMCRHGKNWVTNIRQGGRAEAVPAEGPMAELAVAAAQAVGAVLAGVDLIRDDKGNWTILEVNSMPAWAGLQQVSEIDITQSIADGLLNSTGLGVRRR